MELGANTFIVDAKQQSFSQIQIRTCFCLESSKSTQNNWTSSKIALKLKMEDKKMEMLIKIIDVFAKEKLNESNKDLFLKYRGIQCSEFANLTYDQEIGDIGKLKQMN